MSVLKRLFGETKERSALKPLYGALVEIGRDPDWYLRGGVPDTLDGRFDMIASITALALLRLEKEGEEGRAPSVLLTEIFIDDMDGTLRQIGIGDYVVGKHVGRMIGALGGRLGAFREALAEGRMEEAVRRNVFRDQPPSQQALEHVSGRLEAFAGRLAEVPVASLCSGVVPRP